MPTIPPSGSKVPVAFMSYAHHDDQDGRVSRFHERLERELRSQTGMDVTIFKDSDDIGLGEQWRKRLEEGLAAATFLLPIITPSFLTSPYCRGEFETFRGHEQALARDDLILPVYYIGCEDFRFSTSDETAAATARSVLERQFFDWRELRHLSPSDQRAERARTKLAERIRTAMARTSAGASGQSTDTPADGAAPRESGTLPSEGASANRSPRQAEGAAIAREALPPCCVRIDVGGTPAGSGFFAAPGIVVTCHHVLSLGSLSSEEAAANMSVVSPIGGATYEVLDRREWSPTDEDDLAILRVEPADGHAFVLLDSGLRDRDPLHTFGFPEGSPEGWASALDAEGWLMMDRWLKIAQGQVERGLSGSPVLNMRTGAVCAVLRRGVDAGHGNGASAVSVRRLLKLSPTLSSANFRHHTTHRRSWFRLLPPTEQQLLLVQRTSGPAALPGCVLVISVDQSDEQWEVSATVHRRTDDDEWGPEAPLGPIKVDLNSVRALVARVFRDWASREVATRGRVEPGEQIRLLGEILSRALLTAEIGEKFDELLTGVEHGWVEVALHFSDVEDADFKEFVQLPWEHLYLPQRSNRGDVYFAREQKVAFVRTLHPTPQTPKPSAGKLSLLVVAMKPEGPTGPDEDAGIARDVGLIVDDLIRLGDILSESLEVKVIESPGVQRLEEEVTSGGYDAVHYIGFGRFDTRGDRIALSTAAPRRVRYHNANDFADFLESRMPRLVVLQVCRGSETVPADLAAFGPSLLRKGSQAVVAHQYPVDRELTQKFNASLYTALAEGTPLEMAAQVARKKVWSSDSEGRTFLSPAVFVSHPGGLRLAPEARETGLRSRVGALSGHA